MFELILFAVLCADPSERELLLRAEVELLRAKIAAMEALPIGGETPVIGGTPVSPPAGAASPSAPASLHRIRVTGQQSAWNGRQWVWQRVEAGGTAVDLGGGRFATAAHVVEGVNQYVVEVEIGSEWKRGTFAAVQGQDAAVVTVQNYAGASDAISLGEPAYGARVTVVGLKSGKVQTGIISDTRTVSLDTDCPGIQQGDSGGGVFSGRELVGIISAKNPKEPRVVYFTAAEHVGGLAGKAQGAVGYQCINGVCSPVYE